jgi:SAM-dependent methyltransferase
MTRQAITHRHYWKNVPATDIRPTTPLPFGVALDFGSPLRIEDWAPNSRSICEIGCGDGGNLRRLKDAGFDVLGIEPDPKAREIASRTCSVLEGTAENLPPQLNERLFDAVLMIHSLEHCIDPVHAARNVMSLLKPGGIAIIEVSNRNSLGMRSYGVPGAWCDIPRHLNFFTEKSLTSLLLKARLQKISAAYDGYMRQFSPGWTASQYAMWKVSKDPQPPANFDRRAYWLFLRTALAKQEHKYDSVRITARAL